MKRTAPRPSLVTRLRGVAWGCCLLAACLPLDVALANERRDELQVEGFTEPYRTVDVAASDAGIVDHLHVAEGDLVRVGQLLVTLDKELHEAHLAIAAENAATKGRVEGAQAELALRRERLQKLEQLGVQGFARTEEVERARTDVRLGEADLLSAMEEKHLRNLELERAKVQLERRNIRSRLDGVVTKVHKEVGEFVAGNDPVVVTIVQLNPLRLTLSVPRNHAVRLQEKQTVLVRFVATRIETDAQVEYVSRLTDAESNTVTVRLRIDNSSDRFRSGDRCVLDLRAIAAEPGDSAQPERSFRGSASKSSKFP